MNKNLLGHYKKIFTDTATNTPMSLISQYVVDPKLCVSKEGQGLLEANVNLLARQLINQACSCPRRKLQKDLPHPLHHLQQLPISYFTSLFLLPEQTGDFFPTFVFLKISCIKNYLFKSLYDSL